MMHIISLNQESFDEVESINSNFTHKFIGGVYQCVFTEDVLTSIMEGLLCDERPELLPLKNHLQAYGHYNFSWDRKEW